MAENEEQAAYPTKLLDFWMSEEAATHQRTVKEHQERVSAAEAAAAQAERDRITAKAERKAQREANKLAEQIQALREQIEGDFVSKAATAEGIVFQEFTDIDGHGQKDTQSVTVLGGFLGQLMMVLHTIQRHYARLDLPPKSSASSRRPESVGGDKEDDKKSVLSGE